MLFWITAKLSSVYPKIKVSENMEDISCRFPQICALIFKHLDDKSLVQCRLVCRKLNICINGEKTLWLRMIQNYYGNLDKHFWAKSPGTVWKMVLDKSPTEIIKELAITVHHFFYQRNGASGRTVKYTFIFYKQRL